MRKNRMMRVASALLVVVLLTTCAISGTFAKYVTNGTATASARVAEFGVSVTGSSDTMFAKAYNGTGYTVAGGATKTITVEAETYVVAPGTNGTLAAFGVKGSPEVAVEVTYDNVVVEIGNNWVDKNGDFYCPIAVTVNTVVFCGLDYEDADEFESDIEEAIQKAAKNYAPNTNLDGVDGDLSVSWNWYFDQADHLNAHGDCTKEQDDEMDTYLGDRAVVTANAGTISVAVTCTVTQID